MDALGTVLFVLFLALLIAIPVAMLVFWIIMLVHAARSEIRDQTIWILIIVLTGIIGAIIYYFVVKRPYERGDQSVRPPKTAA